MADLRGVRPGMQVLGSDGGMIGVVDVMEGDRIAVRSTAEPGGEHHHIPRSWVARVDDHVHLDRTAAVARDAWKSHSEDMPSHHASGHAHDHHQGARKVRWLPWLVLAALVLLGLYVLVRGLDYSSREPNYEQNAAGTVNAPDA